MGQGRFVAFSCGSRPTGDAHAYALRQIAELGGSVDLARVKSWQEFLLADAPHMDLVLTLCEESREAFGVDEPRWPGEPVQAHWSLPDPERIEGSERVRALAYNATTLLLRRRLTMLLALSIESMSREAFQAEVADIGLA